MIDAEVVEVKTEVVENEKHADKKHEPQFKIVYTGDGRTKAIVKGCKDDAFNRVCKRVGLFKPTSKKIAPLIYAYNDELEMNDKYCATVKCSFPDKYDNKVGESEAVRKAMINHNNAFRRAIKRWMIAIIKDIKQVDPDIFNDVINEIR